MGIALEGVMYAFELKFNTQTQIKLGSAIKFLKSPRGAIESIKKEIEVFPSIRHVDAFTQLNGVTKENVSDFLKTLCSTIPTLKIVPRIDPLSYKQFAELEENPTKLFDYCTGLEVRDDKTGLVIHINTRPPCYSYESFREELANPDRYYLAVSVDEMDSVVLHRQELFEPFTGNSTVYVTTRNLNSYKGPMTLEDGVERVTGMLELVRDVLQDMNS